MKVLLISMPDVVPVLVHEAAVHLPNHGIASIGGNIDEEHDVFLVDLVRKRRSIKKYLTRIIGKIQPDLIGLSSMAWQFDTCVKIAHLIKTLQPGVKIVVGGYHATLMSQETAASKEARWIDFLIRGEGEEACRRLVNALAGRDRLADIASLSYKVDGVFIHNGPGENLDLSTLKLPLRDKRRLTWGYHLFHSKIELIETSRGCTRTCNFCSMRHMYGRTFRTFPISRVLEDIDDIYYNKKTRYIFITDDNMVLKPDRVIELCDAIIARNYKGLRLIVQADCLSMAKNEVMVAKMAEAGFCSVFLGIENISKKSLNMADKGDTGSFAKQAVDNCHKHNMMVIGGLIFGFPEDDEAAIRENYEFFNQLQADAAYCQVLTPYPKTGMREQLLEQGLVTNALDYKRYNGLWANVRTRYLDSEQLQYQFWYQRQVVLGWWNPPAQVRSQGWAWISIWRFIFKPFLKIRYRRIMKKYGWQGRYQKEMQRWEKMNKFHDLEEY
ncbi:B12-binding domain-containing radical SAM protein [Desulforhopalus sp. IMCC35007]|uniref:B12-binding domain-containing radical SAM protein n=1 Tax=Desulforhopalus sp. IMCC35007 TaxID=2569543 RepID=UPI0010AED259|nr:radical SAM protein [Desulforhopalus sp. IMCC35007]TKB10818.1 B12-binding domain-containing radical SAM protein [Desulforhopalus sp. IMCC35007]